MSRPALADELQLIRAMTVLATAAVSAADDGIEPSRLPEVIAVLEHVGTRIEALEASLQEPKLKAVRA